MVTFYLCYAMASDIWGFSRTFLVCVIVCLFVVHTVTPETEEETSSGKLFVLILG